MAKSIADKKTLAIVLLIALALMVVPIPFVNGTAVGQVAVLIVAIVLLLK